MRCEKEEWNQTKAAGRGERRMIKDDALNQSPLREGSH